MKNALFIFLAVCTLAAAMVPRDRRALNTEDNVMLRNVAEPTLCEPQTPCSWTLYKGPSKIVEAMISNTFCTCSSGTTCRESEFDRSSNAIIFRCQSETEEKVRTLES